MPTIHATVLFIDTLNTPAYVYQDLIEACKANKGSITYMPWYDPQLNDMLKQAEIVIVNCGSWLLCNTQQNSALSSLHTLLTRLHTFSGTVCFVVPEIRSQATQTLLLTKLLHNTPLEQKWVSAHYQSIKAAFAFLNISDSLYSASYPTTLLGVRPEVKKPELPTLQTGLSWLPAHPQNAPLGIKIEDGTHTLILLKSSRVTAFGIAENFVYTPCLPALFDLYKKDIAQTVTELGDATSRSSSNAATPTPAAPKQYPLLPFNQWLNTQGAWCGWAEIEPFFDNEFEWIRSLVTMRLNHIWFELNPEWYLSDNGMRKERKEEFLQRIAQWTAGMRRWQLANNPPLRFFIGTDLTSNFAQAPVVHPAVDLCGTVYDKIPAPLDVINFWQPEFFTVLDRLLQAWSSIGNGVAPSGVFLDLEMYHAQHQASQYSATMDFSTPAWHLWLKRRPDIAEHTQQTTTPQERINFLVEHKLLGAYFKALKQEAFLLGKRIREFIHTRIPGGLIGVYSINLPHSWFYVGLLAGLSTRTRPLILATFNHRFAQHQAWLEQQGIYACHMAPYLLSKLQKPEDAPLITTLATSNNGVWFNKIRLPQSRDKKDWAWDFGLEVTPLETDIAIKAISDQISTITPHCTATP